MSARENILLAAVWGAVIITGFLALGAIVSGAENLLAFGRIHSLFVRLGAVYTCVYIYRCRAKILKYIGYAKSYNKHTAQEIAQPQKGNRVVKIMKSVVFHILLHMVSIHLAVVYTFFHIIRHRQGLLSLFTKKFASQKHRHLLQGV